MHMSWKECREIGGYLRLSVRFATRIIVLDFMKDSLRWILSSGVSVSLF